MKNWIKAFAIVCLSIFILSLLAFYAPYVMAGIVILTIVGGITYIIKSNLDDYGNNND